MAVLPLLRPTGETIAGALARLGSEKKRLAKLASSTTKRQKKSYAREAAASLAQAEGGGEVSEAAEAMDVDGATNPVGAALEKGKAPVAKRPKDPIEEKIENLTDLASTLTGVHGETDAYELTHGAIVGMLKSEGAVRRDWIPPSATDEPADDGAKATNGGAAAAGAKRPLIQRPTASTAATRYSYRFKPSGTVTPDQATQVYGPYSQAEMHGWASGGYFGSDASHIDVKREGSDVWTSWTEASS